MPDPKKDDEPGDQITTTDAADDSPAADDNFDLNNMSDEPPIAHQQKAELLSLLDACGLAVGDYTTLEDLENKLMVALRTKKAHHNAESQKNDAAEPPVAGAVKVADDGSSVMMNLRNDPVAMSLYKQAEESERSAIAARTDALLQTGRISPVIRDMIKPAVDGFRLSLNPTTGEKKPGQIHSILNILERLPAGATWEPGERTKRMSVQEVEQPADVADGDRPMDDDRPRHSDGKPMTDAEVNEMVERLAGRKAG